MPRLTPEPNRPFRWDLVRSDELGSLIADPPGRRPREAPPPGFNEELTACAARILALCDDADLYFVGRSPDSVFDLMSGLLSGTSLLGRLRQCPLSLSDGVERLQPDEVRQLRANLAAEGISPDRLARGRRPVALVDLVATGATFGRLHAHLRAWAEEEREPWRVIRAKLRYIGITERTKTSPNTWRWQQHAPWAAELPARSVRNVSVDRACWDYLGNAQPKIAPSFRRHLWADRSVARARHDGRTRTALAEAVALVEHGRTAEARADLRDRLRREPAARQRWLRSFLPELRG